jgi:cyclophilin family peptidyl-prolyl cis-trans isomerase
MKNTDRWLGRRSIRSLRRLASKQSPRRLPRLRHFETLEARLMLHGANGPHAADPAYDPSQLFHFHADLAIYVDSELVVIPDDLGIGAVNFTSFMHTHSGDPNRLHLEPNGGQPTEFVTLGAFFDVWRNNAGTVGNNPNAILTDSQLFDNAADDDNTLQAYVNGERLEDHFASYQIHDGDNIVLTYGNNPVITWSTNAGSIPVLLLRDEAPETVKNYLRYANGGVDGNGYLGSIFHRNEKDFVLQGGGFRPTSLTTTDLAEIQGPFDSSTGDFKHHIPTFDPIPDERMAGDRSNTIGTIALAKNSFGGTSEFYLNARDNNFLDNQGFTVFAIALGRRDQTPRRLPPHRST